MKIKFKPFLFICFAFLITLSLNCKTVFAEEISSVNYKKVNVDFNKQWTVRLNFQISKNCINSDSFTVVDNNNQTIDAKVVLGSDGKSVIIQPPNEGYKSGKVYYLKISNVYSTDNQKLNGTTVMKFYSKEVDTSEKLLQFEPPKNGEEIALVSTNKGDFKIKFFPEQAPKAVENFKTHIKQGYYNGLIFHRVIPEFMIQGGDPLGNGTGGESIWGEPFNDEFTTSLHNFRGALSMANAGVNTNGSQFFIVQKSTLENNLIDQLKSANIDNSEAYSKEVVDKYMQIGGTPWLDYHHTVFGQVFEGMDVVDDISSVKTDSKSNKPIENVVIKNIELISCKDQ